ncbi:MAG: hypothetical protein N2234_06160, partial [Planctomycetota bacterium]|nr:hypothetical protein [Planctomycetota bacterium]
KMNPVDGAEWFVYKRPFVPLNFSVKPPEEAELYPPQLSATLEGIKVKLSWTDSGENKNVRILVYKLLRKGEDDKQFKLLRELLLPQKEYTD